MKTILIYSSMVAAMLSLAPSCTIKEDRMNCPCKLTLDMGYCSRKWETVSFDLWDIKPMLTEDFGPDFSGLVQYDIRRGYWTATAYAGVRDSEVEDGIVHIRTGYQSDKLFAFSGSVDATVDEVLVNVVPHKQYACLTIDLTSYGEYGETFGIELVGNVAGLNLKDLSPVEGEFDITVEHKDDNIYDVLVPRQMDASLQLLFRRGGEILNTVGIGEYIVRSGYDWAAEDLEDVTVRISYSRTDVVVEVVDWDVCDTIEDCVI